jgi:hypothetical protein
VRPSETPSFEVPEEGAFLRVIPPPDLAGGTLDVGVRGRTADRYPITMRVTDRAKAIDVHIPQGWLLPGDYTVALQPIDAAGRPSAPPTVLGFSVRGAAGTR